MSRRPRVRRPPSPQAAKTVKVAPAAQVAGFLAQYDPEIARLARTVRARLRKRMPTATELVYDNYNALVFAFGATDRASDIVCSIALYPRWVTLFFLHGAELPDPDGLLAGSGSQIRGVRLAAAADVDAPAVRALLDAAIRVNRTPLPAGGRGQTIVRSVAAKQRPRRPPPKTRAR